MEELAVLLGIEVDALVATIDRYNNAAVDGQDPEFGRRHLGSAYGKIRPIAAPPFYGFPCSTSVIATYCGLAVDATMQLVNPFGEPVGNVFAAGEVVGGLHGEDYMSGAALSKAAIFGHIAGTSAAKFAAARKRAVQ